MNGFLAGFITTSLFMALHYLFQGDTRSVLVSANCVLAACTVGFVYSAWQHSKQARAKRINAPAAKPPPTAHGTRHT